MEHSRKRRRLSPASDAMFLVRISPHTSTKPSIPPVGKLVPFFPGKDKTWWTVEFSIGWPPRSLLRQWWPIWPSADRRIDRTHGLLSDWFTNCQTLGFSAALQVVVLPKVQQISFWKNSCERWGSDVLMRFTDDLHLQASIFTRLLSISSVSMRRSAVNAPSCVTLRASIIEKSHLIPSLMEYLCSSVPKQWGWAWLRPSLCTMYSDVDGYLRHKHSIIFCGSFWLSKLLL